MAQVIRLYMHNRLSKLLNKRSIKDATELDTDERADFDRWNLVLSKEELNIDDIKHFIQQQLNIIENKWSDYNIEQNKKNELLPYYTVYKVLLAAINSPKIAREALEIQLNQLLTK